MKRRQSRHEAQSRCDCMNRSALRPFHVPQARFIATGDFIFHAPSGALHFHQRKKQASRLAFFVGLSNQFRYLFLNAKPPKPAPLKGFDTFSRSYFTPIFAFWAFQRSNNLDTGYLFYKYTPMRSSNGQASSEQNSTLSQSSKRD